MATKASKDKGSKIPADLADRMEMVSNISAQRLFARMKELRKNIGARPWRGLPVSTDELRERYASIRHDKEALSSVIGENSKVNKEGKLLVKRDLVKKFIEFEKPYRDAGVV